MCCSQMDPQMKLLVDTSQPHVLPYLEFLGISRDRLVEYDPREEPVFFAQELTLAAFLPKFESGFPLGARIVHNYFARRVDAVQRGIKRDPAGLMRKRLL